MEFDHRTSYILLVPVGGEGDSMELPFYADYMLDWKGQWEMKEGEEVVLLLVHPDVALVLREWEVGRTPEDTLWQRIGIARGSEGEGSEGCDWMALSSVRTFTVI